VNRFYLLGSAAGGFIAADDAVSSPERLHGLTLASSQSGVADSANVHPFRRNR
jgi:hypothetical protein